MAKERIQKVVFQMLVGIQNWKKQVQKCDDDVG